MRATIPIGLPPRTKLLRIDRVPHLGWRVWINQSPCGNLGTFLLLHNDGRMSNVTVRADQGDDEFIVKGTPDEDKLDGQ
jgi:hypothetical protein